MRKWAIPLLRCPTCTRGPLEFDETEVGCRSCGATYPIRDDITDFLRDSNPVVQREREAVQGLDDRSPEAAELLALLLRRLEEDGLVEADYTTFPCLAHAEESKGQIRELLKSFPLTPAETIVELGADHCWASGFFLNAGCRVIAVDITDHLRLAVRGGDSSLCRINADMNALPLRDGSVDVIWATAAAHHSWDLGRTFRESARVLRPGGRLCFCCEPMPSWARYPFGHDFGHNERALGINETWIPRRAWLRRCRRAGFEPRLVFPSFTRATIEARLASHGLPRALAPLARPFLPFLQVSIHLVARRA